MKAIKNILVFLIAMVYLNYTFICSNKILGIVLGENNEQEIEIKQLKPNEKNILGLLKNIKAQIELNHIKEAVLSCTEVVSLIESEVSTNDIEYIKYQCDDALIDLISRFILVRHLGSVRMLMQCRFDVVMKFFKGKSRLFRLAKCGMLMQEVILEMLKQHNEDEFKDYQPLMDKFLQAMRDLPDVEKELKCKETAWFLKCYAFGCNESKNFPKSKELHEQAIDDLEKTFGDTSAHYKVYGVCHNNLGWGHETVGKFQEAQYYYNRAVELYNAAKDCKSEAEKRRSVTIVTKSIARITDKLNA